MKTSSKFLHTGIAAIGILFLTRLSPAGEAPPFLVVGQSYNVILVGNQYQFRVLEIGKEGWIKVALRQQNRVAWINTNAVPVIGPHPAQTPR
jgi:hypothetical protein